MTIALVFGELAVRLGVALLETLSIVLSFSFSSQPESHNGNIATASQEFGS